MQTPCKQHTEITATPHQDPTTTLPHHHTTPTSNFQISHNDATPASHDCTTTSPHHTNVQISDLARQRHHEPTVHRRRGLLSAGLKWRKTSVRTLPHDPPWTFLKRGPAVHSKPQLSGSSRCAGKPDVGHPRTDDVRALNQALSPLSKLTLLITPLPPHFEPGVLLLRLVPAPPPLRQAGG